MKNNDWIILNSINYKIHSIEEEQEMRLKVMDMLGYLIDFDSASFYIVKGNNPRELTAPIGIHYTRADMEDYINIYKNIDYSEGLMYTGKNIAYRESDILSEKERIASEYYKKVYDVQGWHYSLHLNISFEGEFLGVMSFFRKKKKEDFEYEDIFILDMVKDHLALRLKRDKDTRLNKKMTVQECAEHYGLSEKETQVLQWLLTDKTPEEISDILDISVSTYRKHCNRIYKKTDVSQRIELYDKVLAVG